MDLSLIPTGELLDTLMTRYDAVIIAGVQDRNDTVEGEGLLMTWRHQGDHHRCMGLAHHVAARVQDALDDITQPWHAENL